MGRKKKGEKMYVTVKEWEEEGGGMRESDRRSKGSPFKPLPYNCCALSLLPFENPVAAPDGTVFDILNIIPYLKKHKKHPITGLPLAAKDLIKLTFHKHSSGEYICPITYKAFTDHSHIVFIRTTGHVYSMEAIQQLNIKTKCWQDLITGEPFTRKDIITIQDPQHLERRNISNFHYRKEEAEQDANSDTPAAITEAPVIPSEPSTKRVKSVAVSPQAPRPSPSARLPDSARPASGASASFTCAGFSSKPIAETDPSKITKRKGYVRLHTNFGNINLELHCDLVPKTCENFLLLAERGYYNNTIFHRVIPKFMIQGGDPTGTGRGGESAWGNYFKDEFVPTLQHSGRGVVSMANAGVNTNTSQFFILFRGSHHLDNKHSVFGRVVGGMDVLDALEAVPTDDQDRPRVEVQLHKVTVFVNPFNDLENERAEAEAQERAQLKQKQDEEERGEWFSNPGGGTQSQNVRREGVGKYLDLPATTGGKDATNKRKRAG